MSREGTVGTNKVYYQVFDGSFRTKVPSTHPDAIERINKNGKQVFEREVGYLVGKIEDIKFEDSDYGQKIVIMLDANDEGKNPVISFIAESKDGRDVMKKLPSLDFSKEVMFAPYKWTPEGEDKPRSGLTVSQENASGEFQKVENFFWNSEKKEFQHDYPTLDWDTATDSQKKIYKIQRDEFLLDYTKKHVLSRFTKEGKSDTALDAVLNGKYDTEEADRIVDEMPF